jgi:hypothetical protein
VIALSESSQAIPSSLGGESVDRSHKHSQDDRRHRLSIAVTVVKKLKAVRPIGESVAGSRDP